MIWLPKYMYESIPYILLVIGLTCINSGINVAVELFSVLLTIMAAFVIMLRRNYRNTHQKG